ncbi:FecR family protein [Gracilinema caldarium]|uniref:FecR protein domain-containing protein n=1 Tax=Gracilinema caldarium (strain ATCC 51460 / DSM 7334 / H1) TaxID=744872 RepID=F8EX81_GRAC1|nr:FecR family protein [Gracilinema caldarium]AEJ18824.1 hypothetical protein Spica_0670 [Gracilinema caldarium DSM 7334]
MHTYKRFAVLFVVVTALETLAFAAQNQVGIVQEIMGTVTVTRNGKVLSQIDLGDPIENYDLIKTGSDGGMVIGLTSETGMRGTLIVKPKSVFTVKTQVVSGSPKTEADVLGGSIGVKVKKISGDPSLNVKTGNTVMGVRGTEFVVVISVNNGLLVTCNEGKVACTGDEGDELYAVPGQVVARTAGERLKNIPVAVSSLEDFQNRWYTEEISAFKSSAVRALDQYARAYFRYRDDFRKKSDELAREPIFLQWKKEFREGIAPAPSRDIQVMKQKAVMVKKLMNIRQVLFFFERIYYRLDEIQSYVPATALRSKLYNGQNVQDFMRLVASEKSEFERRAAEYRFALRLYAQRNDGKEPVSIGDEEDSFFDDTDSFFQE